VLSPTPFSPRLNFFIGDELPVWRRGAGRQQRQVHGRHGALLRGLGGFVARHVGADPTGTAGVHQHLEVMRGQAGVPLCDDVIVTEL